MVPAVGGVGGVWERWGGDEAWHLWEKELPLPSGNPETAPPMALQPISCITEGISHGESNA